MPRRGLFQSVQLNAIGWVALLAPGVVLGLLFARITGRSLLVWGVVGGLTILAVAVAIDYYRSSRRPSGLSVEALSAAELQALAEAGRHAGIKFEHESDPHDEAGPRSLLQTQRRHVVRLHRLVQQIRDDPS